MSGRNGVAKGSNHSVLTRRRGWGESPGLPHYFYFLHKIGMTVGLLILQNQQMVMRPLHLSNFPSPDITDFAVMYVRVPLTSVDTAPSSVPTPSAAMLAIAIMFGCGFA
jgi:hypothetical protein